MGYILNLLAHACYLCHILRIVGLKLCLADGELQLNLAVGVAQLHLRLGQEGRVDGFGSLEVVVQPAQRVDGSACYDGGVAVEYAVIVLYSHIHVARVFVLDMLHIHRVAVANDVVGASLLTHLVGLYRNPLGKRVALLGVVHVEIV